jgi:SSS family solute:Na+ symporter
VLNALVAVVVTLVLRLFKVKDTTDATRPSDYGADENDPKVAAIEQRQPPLEPELDSRGA